MFRLTRQEQTVLGTVLALLLLGWAVRTWRATHPAPRPEAQWNVK